jgi:hypothetical protein
LFQSPRLRAELARVGIESLADIRQRRIGDRRTLDPLLASYASPRNSDYFPFVDLNAPRLRFMRRNAVELPSLLVAPVPVVEILDTSWQRSANTPSSNSAMSADNLSRQGALVRDAVVSGKLERLSQPESIEVAAIYASAEQCADIGVQRAWRDAIKKIALNTSAHLSGSELEQMWRSIAATPCYRAPAAIQKPWADLLAAIARRDAVAIVRNGTLLLDQPDPTLAAEGKYIVTAMAAAQLQLGDIEGARAVLAIIPPGSVQDSYRLPLRQLTALAQQTSAGAAQPASEVRSADARR